jgi:hypothetical protein
VLFALFLHAKYKTILPGLWLRNSQAEIGRWTSTLKLSTVADDRVQQFAFLPRISKFLRRHTT